MVKTKTAKAARRKKQFGYNIIIVSILTNLAIPYVRGALPNFELPRWLIVIILLLLMCAFLILQYGLPKNKKYIARIKSVSLYVLGWAIIMLFYFILSQFVSNNGMRIILASISIAGIAICIRAVVIAVIAVIESLTFQLYKIHFYEYKNTSLKLSG